MPGSRFQLYSVIVFAVVIICYLNSLQCGFVFDDVSAIKENKDLRPRTPIMHLFRNDFWGTPMHTEKSHKSYRPLCVLTFRMNYAMTELEPMSYHLVNMILHGVVCIIFMAICRLLFSDITSFIAALMFAVHPIHTEAVTGVVGRAELLSSIFLLLAFLNFAKSTGRNKPIGWASMFVTMVLVVIATLCKEQGITVIGICCVYEVFIAQQMTVFEILRLLKSLVAGKPKFPSYFKSAFVRCMFILLSTIGLLLARVKVMAAELPVFTKFDNPAASAPFPVKQLTLLYLLPVNIWLLLCPSQLCCDWTMGTVPLIESVLEPRNLSTIAFVIVLVKLVHFAIVDESLRSKQVIMCLSFLVLPFIPASNLFFPVGFVVAERILYTPSMGFCMMVALGFQLLIKQKNTKTVMYVGLALLLLSHSIKTVRRNYEWESEYTIFKAATGVVKTNAKLWNNVGHALEKESKWDEALEYFLHATQVQPDDIGAWLNVGRAYRNLNQSRQAEAAYTEGMNLMPAVKAGKKYTTRIAPNHLNVYLNLANLIKDEPGRLIEADNLYKKAITMRPDFVQAYINRGDVLLKLNRSDDAVDNYMTALKYEKDNADIYYNLGVVLKHLINLDFVNEKVYFNLGMLATDAKEIDNAKKWFDKAIEYKEDFRSALFNQALMLSQQKRDMESLPYLEKLLQLHPNHSKGLILLGDVYMNTLHSIKDAKKCYETILEIEPKNIQANHNLCVVYVEEGNLAKAETCLVAVSDMAPNEEYIKKHLNIVRAKRYQQYQQQKQGREAEKESHTQIGKNSEDMQSKKTGTQQQRKTQQQSTQKNQEQKSTEIHQSKTVHQEQTVKMETHQTEKVQQTQKVQQESSIHKEESVHQKSTRTERVQQQTSHHEQHKQQSSKQNQIKEKQKTKK
ncbi:protein O-mannosyl-transferase TMTC3-like [Saccoglossus kowalevskii]|uniref:dolichyl-phosphate-mannose--protein mannosyltransferase n=1 Tax=Saccoglossus kowalevskii TaxID=10224 RepID=A0ABM0MED9_SACKO|nr:PREDICTED: transmembrane and TPR repeat-containing protein 3-like [Saccoglossus kowalevskii]